jgi:hypothetical protein
MATESKTRKNVGAIVDLVRNRARADLSEKQLLQLVIDFANRGSVKGPLLLQAHLDGLALSQPTAFGEIVVESSDGSTELRRQLRRDLAATLSEEISEHHIARLKTLASELVAVPVYDVKRKLNVRSQWSYVPLRFEALLAHAVLLLLDDERLELRADLARCKLDSCQIFFLSSERSSSTGRRRKDYCCDEHMLEAHSNTSANRTLDWRARKAAGVNLTQWRGMSARERDAVRARYRPPGRHK